MLAASRSKEEPSRSFQADYLEFYLRLGAEAQPGEDSELQLKVAQAVRRNPELSEHFSLFPFHQAVREKQQDNSRKHLRAFIRATHILETLCINLILQPWRKEIRTIKTFTGTFVYGLLPVLTNSTLQSVLASIGYLPHNDDSQSEFRLTEDANTNQAIQLGCELLLARVHCYHLLDLLVEDQLEPQEWLEALQRTEQSAISMDSIETKTNVEEINNQEKKTKEIPLSMETTTTTLNPQPKSQHYHLNSIDQSVMEMQRIYPDLAFRGRPLLPDHPHGATSSSKAVYNVLLSKIDSVKGGEVGALAALHKEEFSRADAASGVCFDKKYERTTTPTESNTCRFSNPNENSVNEELSGPQAISLHLTVRTGLSAKPSLKQENPQTFGEHPAELDGENIRHVELESSSSTDEEGMKELAEKMVQLSVKKQQK